MSIAVTVRIGGAVMLIFPLLTGAVSNIGLSDYQREDGAIVLKRNIDFVDPYFSTKALLLASQHGLNVHDITQKWINWLLPRQLPDGRFMRYSKPSAASEWVASQDADADDAMMAMWVALLARTTQGEMSVEVLNSVDRALTQLESLRVVKNIAPPANAAKGNDNSIAPGIYTISSTNPAGLLMDNVEIYEAYVALSKYFTARGPAWRGKTYAARALAVAEAIEKVFWDPSLKRYRITTQVRQADDFYPDRVAQLFPLLGGLPDAHHDYRSTYKAWQRMNKQRWLMLTADYYPWGLVAIVAKRMGDSHTALCWAANAEPLRAGSRWNVLEEVAYTILTSNTGHAAVSQFTDGMIGSPLC